MSYVVFDLETSSLEMHKKKANVFFNRVLCIGLKYQKERPIFHPIWYPDDTDQQSNLFCLPQDFMPAGWLDGVTTIIGHNIGFDLKFIWRDQELQDFFKRGGKVWCTAAAEFILSKQQHKFPALRDIAVNKYGCKERVKNIEKLFASGLDTTQGDMSLLLADVKNDVLDTEQVALQQIKKAKENGMAKLIAARMDSLLATIEMEYNGVKTDLEILNKNKALLQEELEKTTEELNKYIKKYFIFQGL